MECAIGIRLGITPRWALWFAFGVNSAGDYARVGDTA